jgi:hypothetical protein
MLIDYLKQTDERIVTKWRHYFAIYERELHRFLSKPITFLEIGIFYGGSIPMWKKYLPEGSKLVFVDINPDCKQYEIDGTHVRIGSQADPAFLTGLAEEFGPFDVILDDGSHICKHQIISYETLWPHLRNRGLYMVEDCHSSYWPGFGGGFRHEGSFVEYAKTLIDAMHSWYTDEDKIFPFDARAKELNGIRFYDSIVVIEKVLQKEPPISLTAQNGKVTGTRMPLEIRGRRSVFRGKDDG